MAIIGDLTKGSSSGVGSAIVFGKFTDLLIRGLASIVLRVAESLKDLTWIQTIWNGSGPTRKLQFLKMIKSLVC